jgi:uncharacterized protein
MGIQFAEDKVLERVRFENPWWDTNAVGSFYSKMKKRAYFKLFFPVLEERTINRAVVLMGPRRVGKTVLIFHAIQKLLDQGTDPKSICYVSIETPIYNGISLEELLHLYFKASGRKKTKGLYFFFDEIQYLKDWEVHLKTLVDSYREIKFTVSGSAAAALKLKSIESGAGRFTDFMLPPLTFHEYLELTGQHHLIINQNEPDSYSTKQIEKLNELFFNYINYGGYPEVSLSSNIQKDPGRYIRNDIIDKVLLRDLPSLYGISDIMELNSLFTYFAYNSGAELSMEGISQESGVAKNTIRKYIEYMKAAFLITVIERVDQNAKRFKRANYFKIYLTNPSLRAALFSPVTPTDLAAGLMVETAIFSQWLHMDHHELHYARWKGGEVDMVRLDSLQKPIWAVEIKWSNRYAKKPKELVSLIEFFKQNKIEESPYVTSIDITTTKQVGDLRMDFYPAALYCYTVARNVVEGKKPDV